MIIKYFSDTEAQLLKASADGIKQNGQSIQYILPEEKAGIEKQCTRRLSIISHYDYAN